MAYGTVQAEAVNRPEETERHNMTTLGLIIIGSACFTFGALIVLALCKSAAKGDEMIERKGTRL